MILVLWASPNDDGLTAECAQAAAKGIQGAGGACRLVKLNELGIGSCRACGDGWGTCRDEHRCQVEDGFQALHAELREAEALAVVTPVYWGGMAEAARNFFDRLRRCENEWRGGALAGKPMLAVAAAGGSGNGTLSCLADFERLAAHLGMRLVDAIPVKRYTKQYQLAAVEGAAAALAGIRE
jgi:multimeric flavodoxin WrbA